MAGDLDSVAKERMSLADKGFAFCSLDLTITILAYPV